MRRREIGFTYLRGVIAAEINRLTHFGNRIRQWLAGLANRECEECRAVGLQQFRDAPETRRALVGCGTRPSAALLDRHRHCSRHVVSRRFDHCPDPIVTIGWITNLDWRGMHADNIRTCCGMCRVFLGRGFAAKLDLTPFRELTAERGQLIIGGEIDAARVDASWQQCLG